MFTLRVASGLLHDSCCARCNAVRCMRFLVAVAMLFVVHDVCCILSVVRVACCSLKQRCMLQVEVTCCNIACCRLHVCNAVRCILSCCLLHLQVLILPFPHVAMLTVSCLISVTSCRFCTLQFRPLQCCPLCVLSVASYPLCVLHAAG